MDTAIVLFVQKLVGVSPAIDAIGVFCASVLIWVEAALIGVFWLLRRRERMLAALTAFIAAFAAWLVNQGIGELFFRPRPFAVNAAVLLLINKSALEKSFPSDHAAAAFALAFAVFMVNRRWGWTLLAMAALISIARVYAGVHYPSDVLAGAAIGILCAYIIHRLVHKVLRTRHHRAG